MSKLLNGLNRPQREAVTHKLGPLLIIAGPGSGKTRTVVHSIAHAIENGVLPEQILAFSFTIKASGELRKRVKEIVGKEKGDLVNISTFHRFCRWVLREDIEKLQEGYTREYKALEEKDQDNIIRKLRSEYVQRLRNEINYIQHHKFPNSDEIINFIKKCKARGISPSDASSYVHEYHLPEDYVKIYNNYEQRLKCNGWIDYESQQIFTDELFSKVPEVKVKWQDKFELIFVDEYQDTDPVQYRIINALAEKGQNLRVVGDDDQGIYGFRGADIQNILNFEKDYPNAKVISLGQNYRSTQEIVAVTRALADFNPNRREKELFTRNFEGEKVKYFHCDNNEKEAEIICSFIHRAINQGGQQPSDFAVLYRINKQAQVFKNALRDLGIQYDIVHDSSDKKPNGVSMMTIHKSKGLEFPNVFVTGICHDLLPNFYSREEKDWDEELRLLYVAMTRAKNWLCLSSYEEEIDSSFDRGRSPFLERGYIPINLIESLETLENTLIPPIPEERSIQVDAETTVEDIEPIPEKLLGDGMTVLGIDPGIRNVGWAITQKNSVGYTVLKSDTQTTTGWQQTLVETERKINELIDLYQPEVISIEKLEGAKEDWFRYVAGCVTSIRGIADQNGIECHLYTPQQVKFIATNNRYATKQEVQRGVMQICNNLDTIPEPHHTADAIATSLCYLRSYLNSSRFEGNKRKKENLNKGCAYLDKRQYKVAVSEFKEAINIDPIYTDAYSGMGRVHLAQSNVDAAENAAKKALKLADNNHPDSQKLLDAIRHYRSGCNSLNNREWNIAIDKFQESINIEPIFTDAHCGLSKTYLEIDNLEAAKNAAEEALSIINDYPSARECLDNVREKYFEKGKSYFNRKQYNQAIAEFQEAVKIAPNFKIAHRYLGEAHFKLGDLKTAEKKAREALRIDDAYESASKLLVKIKQKHKEHGDDYQNRKAYTEAVKSYLQAIRIDDLQAIRIDDKYKDAYNNLGTVYRKMQEYSKAKNVYQQAINIDKRCHVAHTYISIVYLEIGEYTKAVSSLKRAIEIKPDYQTAYYNLARTYFKMENLPDASEKVLEAKRLDANDQDTLNLLKKIQDAHLIQGHDYFRMSDLDAAELSAKEAFKLNSSYQPAIDILEDIKQEYYNRGLMSLEQNEWNSAEKFSKKVLRIEKALRIDPNYQLASGLLKQAYYKQGLAHIKNSSYDKGINKLLKANDIDPNCEKTYYYLGLAYFKLDRLKEAQLAIKNTLSIQRNYPQAHKLLSEINNPRNWPKLGLANMQQFARWILNLIRKEKHK